MISINIEKKLKAYSGQQLLKVDKDFAAGSVTAIYGPSGAGKSTFLRVIAGLAAPEQGTIKVNGATWLDTAAGVSLPPQKRMPGFVFQNYALFPNMTVRQHLEYAANDNAWIERLLAAVKLETLSAHKPEHLSGGQQQRLAILRALAIRPGLLLMDEPFSALDPKMKALLIGELKQLVSELRATVLIVSHNPRELDGWPDNEMMIDTEQTDNMQAVPPDK